MKTTISLLQDECWKTHATMMVDGFRDSERRMRPRPCGHLMGGPADGK